MADRVLIVEDEPHVLSMLEFRLKQSGYDVLTAGSGTEALKKAREEDPKLIVLDVMMPPPNGYQVCRMLKDDAAKCHIPVILLTARSTESDKFWGMESGADDYVTKPYDVEELINKIKSFLEKG
ncbi:response regulator transcription factor [Candidatus Auribacterota bacterium]